MIYQVSVEKRMFATGTVEVEADSPDDAMEIVQSMIDSGELQTTAVEWGDAVYEDCSFDVTGDVD